MTSDTVLTLTPEAKAKVREVLSSQDNAEDLALWLEVTGMNAGDFAYDMYLQEAADAAELDNVQSFDGLRVVVPASSIDKVIGATLDVEGDDASLVLTNPNSPIVARPPGGHAGHEPAPAAPVEADLSHPLARRVAQILEEEINPAIASHGGVAQLVAVEDATVYLRLGGGCQGCGMASVTLSQGIEVAIRDALPEIERIVDFTDHASGSNPYYEASKK